jgi:hypothetical protein
MRSLESIRYLEVCFSSSLFSNVFSLTSDEEQRILTRCDTFPERSINKKKKNKPYLHKTLTSIYPHLDQYAVILDDREDIWSDSIEVLLAFVFFPLDFSVNF